MCATGRRPEPPYTMTSGRSSSEMRVQRSDFSHKEPVS